MRLVCFIMILLLITTGCSQEKHPAKENGKEIAVVFSRQPEIIATDLHIPWNINKHDNNFFLSERTGNIIKINMKGLKTVQKIEATKDILAEIEGGFLGFILAPDFESTKEAFASHTYKQGGEIYNRIIRLKLYQDSWKEESILLEKIPGGRIHNGGRLKIGPDGKLYATTGDAGISETF